MRYEGPNYNRLYGGPYHAWEYKDYEVISPAAWAEEDDKGCVVPSKRPFGFQPPKCWADEALELFSPKEDL